MRYRDVTEHVNHLDDERHWYTPFSEGDTSDESREAVSGIRGFVDHRGERDPDEHETTTGTSLTSARLEFAVWATASARLQWPA